MQPLVTTILLPFFLLLGISKHTFEQSVPVTGVKQSNLTLEVPAGKLTVSAGGNALLKARIDYDRLEWKPNFTSSKKGDVTTLNLKQESSKEFSGKVENNWNVSISKDIPLALQIKLGAGDAQIDMSNSALTKFTMETGAGACQVNLKGSKAEQVDISTGVGELTLDLTGSWDHNINLEINGGIGSMEVKVPKNTGVLVKTNMMGSKTLNGFTKTDGSHRNSAYGKSKHTITLKISGGLGSINVTEV